MLSRSALRDLRRKVPRKEMRPGRDSLMNAIAALAGGAIVAAKPCVPSHGWFTLSAMRKKKSAKKPAAKKQTAKKTVAKRGRATKATTRRKPKAAAKSVRTVKRAKRAAQPSLVALTTEQVETLARAFAKAYVDEIEQRADAGNSKFLQAVARYAGVEAPSEEQLQKVAKALGVKPSELGVETASRNGKAKHEVAV